MENPCWKHSTQWLVSDRGPGLHSGPQNTILQLPAMNSWVGGSGQVHHQEARLTKGASEGAKAADPLWPLQEGLRQLAPSHQASGDC